MIVGTAGHIDHGKTALVRALTGVDTDRLKEEKARGITIDLGFAYMPAPGGEVIGFVDVPGHEKFVHNMLAGAGGIDFALLVIAADDGIMPQTREHLAILDLLGIDRGLVAMTKVDLVDAERLKVVRAEIARALEGTGLAVSEIVPVSAVSGEGIDTLRARLFAHTQAVERKPAEGRFRLAVDRSFTLSGVGTVVTGTLVSGAVVVGDHVVVSPSGLPARVRSIHAQNRAVERAIHRGDMVLDPFLHAPTDRIDARLRLLASERKPIAQWMPVRLHYAALEVGARIVLLEDAPITPGGQATVQLVLERPIAATAGDRFVLRDTSAQRTIGGGTFLDLRAPTRKRRAPDRLAQLRAHAIGDSEHALAALLQCPPAFVDLTAFARDRALAVDEVERLAERLGLMRIALPRTVVALLPDRWLALKNGMLDRLAAFHQDNPDLPGIGLERLRLALEPRLPAPAFAAALQMLARLREVALDGAWVRLPSHQVQLGAAEEKLWCRMQPLIAGKERFRPPRVRDVAAVLGGAEAEVRRILKLLSRLGKVDEVAHDHFFLRDTVAEMVEIASALAAEAEGGQFTAAAFRDRLDNGRKVAIQILEFLDRHGVTIRRGDLRRMNKHRLDLFRRPADEPVGPANSGRESSPVGRPDFKSGGGREPVFGGFDSHSLPPRSRSTG
jgi:selenocysteine-specific elongation factor